ncbi:hemolysin family protein [Arcanobacterium phocae]|uniref:Hemolysin, contains CBS domains n=1 Tax=Arcanobacterium phocae TaxID=131112 RepID=A0A1H2LJ22_9ACTO|nr:hemolysin family protein [Arcanobacterium phocae]SDU80628.1 Hemolysin, contains CBS domains [Arcanobacterium phocae]
MSEISAVPLPILIGIAITCALLAAGGALMLSALSRITHAQVEDAEQEGYSGPFVSRIVTHRLAAITAVTAVRSGILVLLGATLMVLVGLVVHNLVLNLVGVVVAMMLTLGLTNIIIPPTLGFKYPVRSVRFGGHLLWWLTKVGSLFVTRRETDDEAKDSEDDQRNYMVERVSESEALEDEEREIVRSVFELSETLVREVMVPRPDMVTIGSLESLDNAISLFNRSGYSRVPVISESNEDVVGVLYLKDVVRRVHRKLSRDDLNVADVMREPVFIPETKMADDLLREMRSEAKHIALAVDEYGGIAGLVTIEDLLEEIVGDMVDEHDHAEPEVEQISAGVYRVPARLPADELGELFTIRIDDDDVETAGGLLTKALGRIPIVGSEAHAYGIIMKADRFEGRRKRLQTIIAYRETTEEDGTHE